MFKPVFPHQGQQVTIFVEGQPLLVAAGQSVAAAVLHTGSAVSRISPRKHQPRGPYCQMGVCYECLMEIDGQPNQQACLILVREGMQVRRQQGEPVFSAGAAS